MRTACPSCDTSYTIPDERIGAKGRKVRCTRCGEEWRVLPVADEPPPVRAAPPPPPPPPPPEPRRAAPVDPFDALDDDTGADADDGGFDVFDRAASAPPAAPEPHDVLGPDDPPAADEPPHAHAPSPPGVAARIAERIRIRVPARHRVPKIRREIFDRVAGRLAPAVGPLVFLLACLTVPGAYVFRQQIVAAAPDLAGLYSALGAPVNLRGLVFGRIETLREIDNGQTVLVVEGSISNVTKQMRDVPALRFSLRGADTQELYAWSIDPKSTTIESGDTIRFRTRLAAPPDQATDVQVHFVERRSQHAGLP